MAKSDNKPSFQKIQVKPSLPLVPHSVLWLGIAIPFAITTLLGIFLGSLTGPNIIAMIPILMGISFAVGPSLRLLSETPIPRHGDGPKSMLEALVRGGQKES